MTKYASSENTRNLLIEAAGELAAEVGFSNVSTRVISERSGENIGSIHYHFGGKDGLFEEVVKTAIADIKNTPSWNAVKVLDKDNVSPEALSEVIQMIVHKQIRTLFDPNKPHWHSQVIYQLIQFEGVLYDLFAREVLEPDLDAMKKFFRLINPEMADDEILLRTLVLQMPIFAHANYMPTILKLLNTAQYSDEYLQMLENILVQQTQLLLGLPLTENTFTKI